MKSKAIKWLGTLLGCLSLVVVVSAIASPVNDKCPLNGSRGQEEATYSVGFCCGNCQGKFTKNPSASIAKSRPPRSTISAPAATPSRPASYKGDLIGFCCNNCKESSRRTRQPHQEGESARKRSTTSARSSGRTLQKTYTVAFCCNNCAGKFKDPAKHIAKVK